MKPIGYLTNYPDGLRGERGIYYDYVFAGNGVFIEAEGPMLAARIPIEKCEIRGLAPLDARVVLRYGKIPAFLIEHILENFTYFHDKELYSAIIRENDEYAVYVPHQDRFEASVSYETTSSPVLLDIHSHGVMEPWFSEIDNKDDVGLRIYGVIGKCHERIPEILLRVGVYGYYMPITWEAVIEDTLGIFGKFLTAPADKEGMIEKVLRIIRLGH